MKYMAVYNCVSLVTLVSGVVILPRTLTFHSSRVLFRRSQPSDSWEISWSTLPHAWSVEMKDTPTRETTLVWLKVNKAPRRAVSDWYDADLFENSTRWSVVLSFPRNVLYVKGRLKWPQK